MLPSFRVRNIVPLETTASCNKGIIASASHDHPITANSSNVASPVQDVGPADVRTYGDGIIRIHNSGYEDLVRRNPRAALRYLDESDGEVISVGSALELSQRLQEPYIPYKSNRKRFSRSPIASRSAPQKLVTNVHTFDVGREADVVEAWGEIHSRCNTEAFVDTHKEKVDTTHNAKTRAAEVPAVAVRGIAVAFGEPSPLVQNAPKALDGLKANPAHARRWASYSELNSPWDGKAQASSAPPSFQEDTEKELEAPQLPAQVELEMMGDEISPEELHLAAYSHTPEAALRPVHESRQISAREIAQSIADSVRRNDRHNQQAPLEPTISSTLQVGSTKKQHKEYMPLLELFEEQLAKLTSGAMREDAERPVEDVKLEQMLPSATVTSNTALPIQPLVTKSVESFASDLLTTVVSNVESTCKSLLAELCEPTACTQQSFVEDVEKFVRKWVKVVDPVTSTLQDNSDTPPSAAAAARVVEGFTQANSPPPAELPTMSPPTTTPSVAADANGIQSEARKILDQNAKAFRDHQQHLNDAWQVRLDEESFAFKQYLDKQNAALERLLQPSSCPVEHPQYDPPSSLSMGVPQWELADAPRPAAEMPSISEQPKEKEATQPSEKVTGLKCPICGDVFLDPTKPGIMMRCKCAETRWGVDSNSKPSKRFNTTLMKEMPTNRAPSTSTLSKPRTWGSQPLVAQAETADMTSSSMPGHVPNPTASPFSIFADMDRTVSQSNSFSTTPAEMASNEAQTLYGTFDEDKSSERRTATNDRDSTNTLASFNHARSAAIIVKQPAIQSVKLEPPALDEPGFSPNDSTLWQSFDRSANERRGDTSSVASPRLGDVWIPPVVQCTSPLPTRHSFPGLAGWYDLRDRHEAVASEGRSIPATSGRRPPLPPLPRRASSLRKVLSLPTVAPPAAASTDLESNLESLLFPADSRGPADHLSGSVDMMADKKPSSGPRASSPYHRALTEAEYHATGTTRWSANGHDMPLKTPSITEPSSASFFIPQPRRVPSSRLHLNPAEMGEEYSPGYDDSEIVTGLHQGSRTTNSNPYNFGNDWSPSRFPVPGPASKIESWEHSRRLSNKSRHLRAELATLASAPTKQRTAATLPTTLNFSRPVPLSLSSKPPPPPRSSKLTRSFTTAAVKPKTSIEKAEALFRARTGIAARPPVLPLKPANLAAPSVPRPRGHVDVEKCKRIGVVASDPLSDFMTTHDFATGRPQAPEPAHAKAVSPVFVEANAETSHKQSLRFQGNLPLSTPLEDYLRSRQTHEQQAQPLPPFPPLLSQITPTVSSPPPFNSHPPSPPPLPAPAESSATALVRRTTAQLTEMGYPADRAHLVTAQVEGDLEKAIDMLEEDARVWRQKKGKERVEPVPGSWDDELYG